jgi:fatty acid desaturase
MVGLCLVNWQATATVFIAPVLLARVLMMCGNWGQHAFVDAADPGNPYRNSITCIHSRYNRRAFNDGYHIHHHVKPRCHWADLPGEFEDNRAVYGAQDAIVFEGQDFFSVWLFLMLGRWKPLVSSFVQLPGAPERGPAEIEAFLKSRLEPVAIEASEAAATPA